MDWLYYSLLMVIGFVGILAIVLGLPGIWLIVLAALGYALLTKLAYVGWITLTLLVLIAILSEMVEAVAGGAGAKREGASKRGIFGAVVGGLIGGLLGTFIPIPIIGNIIGACLGSLVGAVVMELMVGKELEHSLRIGVGAAKGRFLGIISKLGFAAVILIILAIKALPFGGRPTIAGSPATAPSTIAAPATTATSPATTGGAMSNTFTGKLRNGMMAIGGESTGWVLELADGSNLDVDVSRVKEKADAAAGKNVTLHGEVITKKMVERGQVRLLVVDAVEAQP
ncbi:MAG TPA: DUF456 domain-containing protein [Tepidisphaeraceae bacterium]